jgi:hypothetical protein
VCCRSLARRQTAIPLVPRNQVGRERLAVVANAASWPGIGTVNVPVGITDVDPNRRRK